MAKIDDRAEMVQHLRVALVAFYGLEFVALGVYSSSRRFLRFRSRREHEDLQ